MSYSLNIVRKNNWDDINETSNLTLQEWLDLILTDNELEFPSEENLTDFNRVYYQNKPGYCEWNAHPNYKEPFARPWFNYSDGIINTENVDTATMRKIISIAELLNGKVQGQDGEFYEENDVLKLEAINSETSTLQTFEKSKTPWWKFW